MKKNKCFKKFKVSKSAIILCAFMAFLSTIGFIYTSYQKNQIDIAVTAFSSSNDNLDYEKEIKKKAIFEMINDFCVVVFSSTGLSFFLGLFIEKNNKNRLYDEILTEDFLTEEKFLGTLSEKQQMVILNKLESMNFFDGNSLHSEMLNSVKNKIKSFDNDYYFTYQAIDITCDVKSDYIQKTFIRTFKLKSYSPKYAVNNYLIGVCNSDTFSDGKKHYELNEVKINGKKLNENQIEYKETPNEDGYSINSNFNMKSEYYLKNELILHNDEETTIELQYITRVPKNDTSYSVRMSKPCKKFQFSFKIIGRAEYNIYSQAYGFYDNATYTHAGATKNTTKYEFNDWIFPEDGVIVNFSRKI